MSKVRIAIVGLGRLGRLCARLAHESPELDLVGVWRREASLALPMPEGLQPVRAAGHISELGRVEAALVCVPTEAALSVVTELTQHRVPLVECATLEGSALEHYYERIDTIARDHRVPVMVGAGWNPGLLQHIEDLFEVLIPKGRTQLSTAPGVNLHHTEAARDIPGVRAALATEVRGAGGARQHYFYVELARGGEAEQVRAALAADPLFAGEDVLVFPVESVSALEQRGHGVLLERAGTAGAGVHDTLLLEGRFDPWAFTARAMLDAARRLPGMPRGLQRYCGWRAAA
jgi:diaminopimelate dehydrogenase